MCQTCHRSQSARKALLPRPAECLQVRQNSSRVQVGSRFSLWIQVLGITICVKRVLGSSVVLEVLWYYTLAFAPWAIEIRVSVCTTYLDLPAKSFEISQIQTGLMKLSCVIAPLSKISVSLSNGMPTRSTNAFRFKSNTNVMQDCCLQFVFAHARGGGAAVHPYLREDHE